jgi:Xaa-Pro aminopeptidase
MIRGIKTPKEIEKIKKACALSDKIFPEILKSIKIGITEKELASKITRLIRSKNGKLSFRPIVAFGKNASEVHHKPSNLKLRKNHGFIMMDFGAKVDGYCSDITRTVFFGNASQRQKKVYNTVLEAQRRSIKFAKTNCKAFNVDRISREYIIEQKFSNIPHSVGHGIGKKIHEFPRISPKSKTILRNGMAFTIEPGVYIKNFGGVRIEDTFCLMTGKLYQLTKSPKNLLELV